MFSHFRLTKEQQLSRLNWSNNKWTAVSSPDVSLIDLLALELLYLFNILTDIYSPYDFCIILASSNRHIQIMKNGQIESNINQVAAQDITMLQNVISNA